MAADSRRAEPIPASLLAVFAIACFGVTLLLYAPALDGPFLSDDHHYLKNNDTVHELSLDSLAAMFDPGGPATIDIVNYAPMQLLVHALAWQAFGDSTPGHHVVNLAFHALAATLLLALLAATGVPRAGALVGGTLFALHPANVEAVAWISQLKSTLALCLALAALLAWRRRPAAATALFAAALLAKPTAAFALPMAALLDRADAGSVRWRWLGAWLLVFAAFAVVEFAAHQRTGAADAVLYDDPSVLLRTVASLGSRYLVMAATGIGTSAFHEPEPARSLLDPWWLAALPLAALLSWRIAVAWRARSPELAWWVGAAVSFAPVSQVFPFLYPMADRYLYFILPGLLGGCLLATANAFESIPAPRRRAAVLGAAALLAVSFAARTHERAGIWRSNAALLADAAANYPEGKIANVLAAKRAAHDDDAAETVAALRRAAERGFNRFEQLETDPSYRSVRDDPRFRELVRELASGWIASLARKPDPTQSELRLVAWAHVARGDPQAALPLLDAAAERGGPRADEIRAEREAIRRALEAGAPERIRLSPP